MSSKSEKEKTLQNYALKLALNTASHPIEYAKLLIQIGYEPLPPQAGRTFFGKPALKLPNVFQYVKYIKSQDGFIGCYRGLAPKLCGNVASAIICHKVLDCLNLSGEKHEQNEEERREEEDERTKFIENLKRDVVSRFTAIIVSQPFHVITVRMMAQFIGRETNYDGIFSSIAEVYQENGILGFFNGIVPRILGDLLSIILANSMTYILNTYVFEEPELKLYSNATMSFLSGALTYPFVVVSNCMAINDSGLVAGQPPHMPIYTSWLHCWADLSERRQLKRGSSLLIRYYSGPYTVGDPKQMILNRTY